MSELTSVKGPTQILTDTLGLFWVNTLSCIFTCIWRTKKAFKKHLEIQSGIWTKNVAPIKQCSKHLSHSVLFQIAQYLQSPYLLFGWVHIKNHCLKDFISKTLHYEIPSGPVTQFKQIYVMVLLRIIGNRRHISSVPLHSHVWAFNIMQSYVWSHLFGTVWNATCFCNRLLRSQNGWWYVVLCRVVSALAHRCCDFCIVA